MGVAHEVDLILQEIDKNQAKQQYDRGMVGFTQDLGSIKKVKESKYLTVQGLWALRLFQLFAGAPVNQSKQQDFFISFEQFVVHICKQHRYTFANQTSYYLFVESICKSDVRQLDKVLFEIFDLHALKVVSQEDLTQMLMCLPLTAIIVDFGKSKLSQKSQFKIMRSP